MNTMILALSYLLLPATATSSCAQDSGHEHGHSVVPYEWAGVFNTPNDEYKWIAQKVNGAYADPFMKLVAIPSTLAASIVSLASSEAAGKRALNGDCEEVPSGGTIKPAEKCYNLKFDQSSSESTFKIDATGVATIAFFTEHVPTEFEDTKHYLKDLSDEDIEPVAQPAGLEGHAHDQESGHGSEEEEFGRKCACQAQSAGWKLDCKDKANVVTSITYLNTIANNCIGIGNSEECKKHYHVMQAHHDHCLHDELPTDIEKALHSYEMFYQDCFIKRQFDPALPPCSAASCDKAGLTNITKTLMCCGRTATACSTDTCSDAVKKVLMAHDTCPEASLPNDLEIALHDYEEPCEKQLCNSAQAAFNALDEKCSAEVSAAGGLGSQWTFLVATLSLPLAIFMSSKA